MATEETKPVEREAQELMETLHDLYGHTFDVLGEEAIKHKLQASAAAALERVLEYIPTVTGPTGGWLVSPKTVENAVEALKGSR